MAPQPKWGPGLLCWGFVTITFLRGWIVSPAPNPQPGGPGLSIYDPRRPSYTPRHWVPILVAFYDMHGLQWDYSLIPATTRDHYLVNWPVISCIVDVLIKCTLTTYFIAICTVRRHCFYQWTSENYVYVPYKKLILHVTRRRCQDIWI
jgi:hypothetical protein